MAIKVAGLSKAVEAALREYRDDVAKAAEKAVKDTAKVCREELAQTSPKLTGDYAAGWKVANGGGQASGAHATVYNKDEYQLTHLLEDGHRGPYGESWVEARPHIQTAADNAAENLEKSILLEVGKT